MDLQELELLHNLLSEYTKKGDDSLSVGELMDNLEGDIISQQEEVDLEDWDDLNVTPDPFEELDEMEF